MKTQLITVHPDGSLSGLQFKKGGVNLQKFGPARTVRISDVEWSEERQCWQIKFLLGTLVGTYMRSVEALDVGMSPANYGAPDPRNGVFGFEDYDAAVAAEVAFIQAARLHGMEYLVGEA